MTPHLAPLEGNSNPSDDLDLVHASKGGNIAAFEQLVNKYDRKLFRVAQSVTHNFEDSQDAVQEAFLKAYQHLAEFREASQFSTWLIRITLNESLMKLRKQRVAREVPLDEDSQADKDILTEVRDWAPNPEQLYWTSELRSILIQTIEEVRPSLRDVFVLRDVEGLSTEQAAVALGLTRSAVKARLWRARLLLRKNLNRYFGKRRSPQRLGLTSSCNQNDRVLVLVSSVCVGGCAESAAGKTTMDRTIDKLLSSLPSPPPLEASR